jgi:hypothetical protein
VKLKNAPPHPGHFPPLRGGEGEEIKKFSFRLLLSSRGVL